MAILETSAQAARKVAELLRARKVTGRVLAIDSPKLEAHLDDGIELYSVSGRRSRVRKAARPVIAAGALPLPARSFAAALVSNPSRHRDPGLVLRECARVVRAGGPVVILDRVDASALSALALCAGLVDICQDGKLTVGVSSTHLPPT